MKNRATALLAAFLFVTFAFAPLAEAEAKKRSRVKKGGKVTRQSARASGVNDPRYADIIMNPVTGEVYHSDDADGQRYPASLTKMMTLYLLFEALEQKRTTLDARMDISSYATSMPQTHLSLTAGDSISVETAIKALVVRSANDVSVVVAEALAGDVDSFAEKMTAKARTLGMNNTVFKNPNGLPNPRQHTTARDMAKLGIALKRDFPRYYRYFSTLSFSHNGVTYYTHNRVMLRYAGVDGIKTGYIGASGFNLVTSVVRGGRPLVGVVLGGASGGWRDNRMIELLDDSYQVVASRGAAKGRNYPANLPLGKTAKGRAGVGVDVTSLTMEDSTPQVDAQTILQNSEVEDGGEQLPAATLPEEREAVRSEATTATPFDTAQLPASVNTNPPAELPAPAHYAPATPPHSVAMPATIANKPVVITAPPSTVRAPQSQSKVIQLTTAPATTQPSPFAVAQAPAKPPETMVVEPVKPAEAPMVDASWGIQVGAFSTQALAVSAARSAMQTAAKPLAAARMALADPGTGSVPVHRARLEGLSQVNARKACEQLIKNNSPCFIYKANQ